MGLSALRRHRHLPAAAALMSVLLYTALVASHIVSQATHRALPSAPGADRSIRRRRRSGLPRIAAFSGQRE